MEIIDKNFKKNKKYYILQSLFASICSFIILIALGTIAPAVIVASIGSSIFILFAIPHAKTIRKRNLMGGYIIGIICGTLMALFIQRLNFLSGLVGEFPAKVIFTSIGVGLSIFLMVLFNCEHPPATGIALGLAIQPFNEWTILFILVSGLVLSGVKKTFGKKMKNLI